MKNKFVGIFSNQLFLHVSSFTILIISIITFYSNFNDFNFNSSFNSDSLGVINLFRDIFQDGGDLRGWRMAGSTCLFPDLLLFYFLFQIFGSDFLTITFFFGIIQVVCVTSLMCYVYRKVINTKLKKYSWLIPLLFSLFFFESYYCNRDQMLAFLVSIYCYHTGTLINTLIAFSISISGLRFILKAIILLIVAFLAAFSDMLFVVMFIGPFIMLNIVQFKFLGLKQSITFIICVLTGAYLGNYLFNYLNEIGFFIYNLNIKLFSFDAISKSWGVFLKHMIFYIQFTDIVGFQVFLTQISLVLIPVALVVFRKKLNNATKYFLWFFLIIAAALFISPIINGIYSNVDSIRYNAAVFYLSTILLAFVIAVVFQYGFRTQFVRTIFVAAILITTLFFAINRFTFKGVNHYFSYYPPKVRALDSICDKNGLKNGISDYWLGKWSTMFSKYNIRVHTVYQWTNIYEFGSNLEWYFNKEFDFIIPDRLDTAQIRKNFVILDSIKSPDILVLKVKKFVYQRDGNSMPKTIEVSK